MNTFFLRLVSVLILVLLPVWGYPLSVVKEKELAGEFMDEIREKMTLIEDPVALNLVREIGMRIAGQLQPQPFEFSFYIVNEDPFNAFAGPGANIFVNRGLITSLDTVDELAGIMGHEIAHSSLRHVAEMIDRSKLVNIGTLAGMLAGVLVGSQGSADVGQAVIMGSAATGLSAMLAYSRENEREADQKGIVYLQEAAFSPRGLLTGLEKIRTNDWYGVERIPGYLKTHPGTKERIVTIESWINTHPESLSVESHIDPHRFAMVKYRLQGLYGPEDFVYKDFLKKIEAAPLDPALNYGMALILARKNRLNDALDNLKTALQANYFDPYILAEMGRLYYLSGKPEKALEVLTGLDSHPDVGIPARYYQGVSLVENGELGKAEKALQDVVEYSAGLYPRAWYFLARIYGEKGENGRSWYYLGRYYYEIGEYRNAKMQVQRSLKALPGNEIEGRAKELMKKLEKKKDS